MAPSVGTALQSFGTVMSQFINKSSGWSEFITEIQPRATDDVSAHFGMLNTEKRKANILVHMLSDQSSVRPACSARPLGGQRPPRPLHCFSGICSVSVWSTSAWSGPLQSVSERSVSAPSSSPRLQSELIGISKNSQIFLRLQSELLRTSMASQVSPRLRSNLSRLLRARIISVSASSNSLHGLHDPSSVWCRPRVFSASLSLILTFLWPFLGSL